eukprot:TRINITY_DN3249_c0_g1_i4.p2 TRINITY_DN3249_c0_g1~~TRINITY_DN3249_c0_g1_i4.p2  ORF type:complete len:176 (-),score=54.58 TRINITY_DN3249_c0_g1_i4:810-1337(-)
MISAILATDMTKHFELVGRFKSYSETAKFHKERKDERQLLLEMIVHAADISNLTRPQPVSRVWSDLLFEEYLQQGDEEKRLGLPVSPYMDRDHTDQVKMSINFVDFIGLPLFTALAREFVELTQSVENLKGNRKWWETRRAELSDGDPSRPPSTPQKPPATPPPPPDAPAPQATT